MIAQARQQVTQAVADALGIPTSPTLPDRLHAPLAAIREADGDFLIPEPDGPYGSWQLTFQGTILVAPAENEVMLSRADELADKLLTVGDRYDLTIHGYRVETVASSQPYLIIPFTLTTLTN